MKSYCIITILFFLTSPIYSQNSITSGRDFWFGYMENLIPGINGLPSYEIQVYAIEDSVDLLVEIPLKGYANNYQIDKNQVTTIVLPSFDFEPKGSGVITDLGIHLSSNAEIEIVSIHNRVYFTSTTKIYPTKTLGKDYFIMAAEDDLQRSPSSFLLVATNDNTEIRICLNPCDSSGTISIVLNKGETYQYQSLKDLTGTEIKASNVISVFSGAKQAQFQIEDDSHIYFAMPPKYLASKNYVVGPNIGLENRSFLKVLALEDNTSVFYQQEEFILNKGRFRLIKLDRPFEITSSKPIFIGQFNSGSGVRSGRIGGPSMIINQWIGSEINISKFNTKDEFGDIALEHGLSIFTRDTASLMINGSVQNNFKRIQNSDYFYLASRIEPGTYQLNSTSGFIGQVYGSGRAEYYSFSLGMNDDSKINQDQIPEFNCGNWNITPNPSSGEFILSTVAQLPMNCSLEIYDARGRFVGDFELRQNSFYKSSILPGMYFARLSCCDQIKKLIIYNR